MLLRVTFTVQAGHPCQAKQEAKRQFQRWSLQYPEQVYLSQVRATRLDRLTYQVDVIASADSWPHSDERVSVVG